jgi:hypothetical protein
MTASSSPLPATIAAVSADWAQRAQAGEQLARWAYCDEIIPVLRSLLLDSDTAVTDATCAALLKRDDAHGVRLIAHAVATATDFEHHDQIYACVFGYLYPDGPADSFREICTELGNHHDPYIVAGALQLLRWAQPWSADDDTR